MMQWIQQKTSGGKPQSDHELDLQLKGLNCAQQTANSVQAQADTGNGCGMEIPGDTVSYQGEKINLVMKKHKKRSLDAKCSEGGRLPVCEVVTGPVLVPKNCIGMMANIYPPHTSGVDPCHNKYIDETNYTVNVEPIPTYDGNANKIQHMTNQSQIQQKGPNVASLNASLKPVASDNDVVDTVNDCAGQLLVLFSCQLLILVLHLMLWQYRQSLARRPHVLLRRTWKHPSHWPEIWVKLSFQILRSRMKIT